MMGFQLLNLLVGTKREEFLTIFEQKNKWTVEIQLKFPSEMLLEFYPRLMESGVLYNTDFDQV